MTGFKQSYCESSITCNGFKSLLDEPTSCGSARYDNMVLQHSRSGTKRVRSDGIMHKSATMNGKSSITRNGFHSLLDEPASGGSDNIVKFLQRLMSGRKLVGRDGKMVNINSLGGKIVGLFFMSQIKAPDKRAMIQCILDIASAYNELSKSRNGQFEIVWIAKVDNELQFFKYLKMMPWLAIPFTDSVARNSMCNVAGIGENNWEIFLFNREGKLFRKNAVRFFRIYGADWYPFTDTRIKEIADEDYAIFRNMDLKNLLGNARRDFVLRNDGGQVSISELENKVVGIYFCDIDTAARSYFTKKLLKVYRQLKRTGMQFEVVMVHTGGWCLKKHVNRDFKNIEWLSLPRGDSNSNRLVRVFDPESWIDDNCLVIVGQRGSFVNKSGYLAIEGYGIEAYPFSRLSVVEIEKKRIEASVKSLLTCGYVIRNSGEKMQISYLSGKTILLLFTDFHSSHYRKDRLVPKLIDWYAETKDKHADFEVILVAFGYDENSFAEYYCQMPWLAFPHDTNVDAVRSVLSSISGSTLAVFGPNGQLVSMRAEYHIYEKGSKAYPFSGKDVLMDVSLWLSERGFSVQFC